MIPVCWSASSTSVCGQNRTGFSQSKSVSLWCDDVCRHKSKSITVTTTLKRFQPHVPNSAIKFARIKTSWIIFVRELQLNFVASAPVEFCQCKRKQLTCDPCIKTTTTYFQRINQFWLGILRDVSNLLSMVNGRWVEYCSEKNTDFAGFFLASVISCNSRFGHQLRFDHNGWRFA